MLWFFTLTGTIEVAAALTAIILILVNQDIDTRIAVLLSVIALCKGIWDIFISYRIMRYKLRLRKGQHEVDPRRTRS